MRLLAVWLGSSIFFTTFSFNPVSAQQYDGVWAGTYSCEYGAGASSFSTTATAKIQSNKVAMSARWAEGSENAQGDIASNGSFSLKGDVYMVAGGGWAGAGRVASIASDINGNATRDKITAQGRQSIVRDYRGSGVRNCILELTNSAPAPGSLQAQWLAEQSKQQNAVAENDTRRKQESDSKAPAERGASEARQREVAARAVEPEKEKLQAKAAADLAAEKEKLAAERAKLADEVRQLREARQELDAGYGRFCQLVTADLTSSVGHNIERYFREVPFAEVPRVRAPSDAVPYFGGAEPSNGATSVF